MTDHQTMTARERILRAMEFRGPDRAPINHWIFPGAFTNHGEKLWQLCERYPDDFDNEGPRSTYAIAQRQADEATAEIVEWRDGWGTLWRRLAAYTSGEVVEPAIPDWDRWGSFVLPPEPSGEYFARVAEQVAVLHPETFVRKAGGGLFQHVQNLRGPVGFFMDIAEDRSELHELLDRLVDHYLPTLHGHLAAGVDCAVWGDDWGTQSALLCSPADWRRIFKPRYQRLFDAVKEHGKKIWVHSDGYILDILPDLVEMGVDLVNPQHGCMGTARVGAILGGKVCVRTDIDRQTVLPWGTPDEVRAAVVEAMDCFGRFNGGVMFHGEIGPEVPFENAEALYAAFYEVGRYR